MSTKKKTKTTTQIERYIIRPAERIEILWKSITKGRDTYDFYDVKYGDVIITGCRIVEGKNGVFLGMPSQERNGDWFPVVYISRSLNKRLCEFIEDADDNDAWEEGEDGEILSFEDSDSKQKSEKPRKSKTKKKDDAEEENNAGNNVDDDFPFSV